MPTDKPPAPDLNALVGKAQRSIESAARKKAAERQPERFRPNPATVAAALWIVLAAIGTIYAGEIRLQLFGVSTATAREEAARALRLSADAVDKARQDSGAMPAQVPVPALAGLVALEPTETGYRLTTSLGGGTTTLNERGNLSWSPR